ncbi:hypothetical protein V6N13_050529 [Hibiscus sabdariffa]
MVETALPKQCLDDQRSSLLQLQHDLYYAPNFTFSSKFNLWDVNADCCRWEGVACDAFGHVIGLDLSYKDIAGNFHSIFNLHHLQHLNLAGNNFNTTLLSYEFDKLPNLTHLDLSSSCFHGQIPVEVSYLTRLVSLDLSNQDVCYRRYYDFLYPYYGFYFVPMPYELKQPLKLEKPNFKNMRHLTELYLDGVDISTQSTKWCETISPVLSKLQVLSLSNCNLGGYFPIEIFLLPKIQSIDIALNDNLMGQLPEFPSNNALRRLLLMNTNFSGKLPESIGNLKFLTDLFLSECHFFGSIPPSIANLTYLVNLDLSGNNFSGLIPPFAPNLGLLALDGNNLSGPINSSLFACPSLQVLSVRGNQLVGQIDEFPNASSSSIEYLYLGDNYLTATIPNSILQFNNLKDLDLSNISLVIENDNKSLSFPQLERLMLRSCNLTEFPEFITTQDKLTFLDLSNNHIHGVVPNWLWKTTLSRVDLSFNPIDFPKQLPLSDANVSFPKLRYLILESCNISAFPELLRSLDHLENLDLSNNRISGAVPNWVWKTSLYYLNVAYNHLSSLEQILSNHSLTTFSQGTLPSPICNLRQLLSFNASHNNLSGTIPNCLGNMSYLYLLDLEGNKFTGILPEFSKATQLWMLKVSENRLERKLPRSLAECTQLQVLDVGNNRIRDTFPFWLEKLPALTVPILRENRFYGEIKHFKNKIVFPTLDVLDIASNEFSGELSFDLLQATQLRM